MTILVIFGENLPKKNKKWFRQFDEVILQKDVETKFQQACCGNLVSTSLEEFIKPGSVQQAYELVNKLSLLTLPDGSRLSKLINYRGYELWWMHYDTIYKKFCLPYTQYADLLFYLKDFERIHLFEPPWPDLFRYFLKAHRRQCFILNHFRFRGLLPVSLGVFIQFLLSLGFLLWLKITNPRVMIRTGDKLEPCRDFDFRQSFIYKELKKRKIPFVEFIRSLESSPTVLRHAWQRKRPVIYSTAIIDILHSLTCRFSHLSLSFSESNPEKRFWFLAATHYLKNVRGSILSIQAMKFILQWIGVKSAIILAGGERSVHEILGCKLAGIKTVGVLHGAIPRYYFVSDFMPEFDGQNPLSVDKYGLWSGWWKKYYLKHSRAFKLEQLYISGSPRPLEKEIEKEMVLTEIDPPVLKKGPIKVLFISEQLASPKEVMPYLSALLSVEDFVLSLKIRPQIDGFERWLKKKEPGILELERVEISKGNIHQAISESDVVVGSHSTAVLEALAQLKPFVFFWTNKWGDYFDIKSAGLNKFFAETPEELIENIKKSIKTSKDELKKLQEQFFGNPYQNGAKWAVDQIQKFL